MSTTITPTEARFDALHTTYERDIARFIAGMIACPELREEVEQETWLKVWNALPRASDVSRTWVYRVAKNATIDRLREEKRRTHGSIEGEELALRLEVPRGNPEETVLASLAFGHVFASLSERERLLLLRVAQGYDYREIAASGELVREQPCTQDKPLTPETVKTLIYRAREKFARKWKAAA